MNYQKMFISVALITVFLGATAGAVPLMINYQGKINVSGTPFDGTGYFNFAIMDETGSTQYWSNDGNDPPTTDVSVSVNNGLYHVILGYTDGMNEIPATVFENDNLHLRIWFDDGTSGSELLAPDQRIVSAGFSLKAEDADSLEGQPGAYYLDWSNLNGIPGGFIDGDDDDTPDDDSEVPDNVSINNGNLYSMSGSGDVGIGTTSPGKKLEVAGDIKISGSGNGLEFEDGTVQTTAASGGVPSGYMILGDTLTPPMGYTYVGQINSGGTWESRVNMPTSRFALGVAAANNRIYAIGGFNGSFLNTNEEYDPATDSWTNVSVMPTSRGYLTVSTAIWSSSEFIYAIGGNTGSYSNHNERFDPLFNSWATVSPMPIARDNIAAAVAGNLIYVLGGRNGSPMPLNQVYDPDTDSWTTLTSMLTSRQSPAAAAGSISGTDYIFVFGGYSGSQLSSVERFDIIGNSWTFVSSMPTAANGQAAVTVNNRIYVLGGFDGSIGMNDNMLYDPETNIWSYREPISAVRYFHGAAVLDGYIYVVGGYVSGASNIHERHEPLQTLYLHRKN